MMDCFVKVYRFGGMSLYHSGYWLGWIDKDGYTHYIKYLYKG